MQRCHLIETAVGICLLRQSKVDRFLLHWRRKCDFEGDFIICKGKKRTTIEVRGSHKRPPRA